MQIEMSPENASRFKCLAADRALQMRTEYDASKRYIELSIVGSLIEMGIYLKLIFANMRGHMVCSIAAGPKC